MKYALIILVFAMGLCAPASAQEPSGDTVQALDFFLGVWRTEGGIPLEDGSWSRNSGILTGERAFRGSDTASVLVRTQSVPDSADTGSPFDIRYFEDITVYVREPATGQWRGIAHNTLGNRKWRDVTVAADSVSFIQRGELFQASQGDVRFTYYNITADRFEMRVDYRPDTETDWQLGTYRMTATRIG